MAPPSLGAVATTGSAVRDGSAGAGIQKNQNEPPRHRGKNHRAGWVESSRPTARLAGGAVGLVPRPTLLFCLLCALCVSVVKFFLNPIDEAAGVEQAARVEFLLHASHQPMV